jgi:DNA mismatch endonuclease (patch repair protein)
MDIVSKETRSRMMAAVRQRNTSLERLVAQALRKAGFYFQRNYRKASGSPDIAFPKRKIAIFVDGDFWHGYRYSQWRHKLGTDFWREKIETNIRRDKRNFAKLRRQGWRVLRVWQHELKKDLDKTVERIIEFVSAD